MKPPREADHRASANPAPEAVDETLPDISAPGGGGSYEQTHDGRRLQVALATDVGRVRHNNEDYVSAEWVLSADGRTFGLWLVADGVGGGPQGERASRMAVETVIDFVVHEKWVDPAGALTAAFALANRNVFDISGEGSAATTLVVALVSESDGCVFIANVGDSRAYLVSGGEAKPITDEHSIVAARVRGRPDHGRRGSHGSRPKRPGPQYRLGAGGPGRRLRAARPSGRREARALHGGLAVGQSAQALVATAVEAGGRDNATALVGGYAAAAPAAAQPRVAVWSCLPGRWHRRD